MVMSFENIWLASASPRRRQILGWTGIHFQSLSTDIDESIKAGEKGKDYVSRLAIEKAKKAADTISSGELVIAADTTVVLGNTILGKPVDRVEAVHMLTSLRNRQHEVITALVILKTGECSFIIEGCISKIQMRDYSDQEIQTYVNTDDPLDKAGAYAIQHPQFDPVINFQGCFASVMGMPLCHLERNLCHFNGYQGRGMQTICQKFLRYTCPIHQRVMDGENIG
jgi:septum formation protein